VVDGVESQVEKFIEKGFVHIGDFLFECQKIVYFIILNILLLFFVEAHVSQIELGSLDQ
jgi:hypothetical protein